MKIRTDKYGNVLPFQGEQYLTRRPYRGPNVEVRVR